MKLSTYAYRECILITIASVTATMACFILTYYLFGMLVLLTGGLLLCFFRDPERIIPVNTGVCLSPADGKVTSIHTVEQFPSFNNESAVCIRIFLSIIDVHINRSPCAGRVISIVYKPGGHINALFPGAAERNESNLITLADSHTGRPIAAVRQIAGMFARRVFCAVQVGDLLVSGQRVGIIKLGSTTELYLPADCGWDITCKIGQRVYAGSSTVARHIPAMNNNLPQSLELPQ